jgi:hypothetical protein
MNSSTGTERETKMNTLYLLQGIQNNYSSSLTYPEDFDTKGLYTNLQECQDEANRLNLANGHVGPDEDGDWEVQDDEYFYTVEHLEIVK